MHTLILNLLPCQRRRKRMFFITCALVFFMGMYFTLTKNAHSDITNRQRNISVFTKNAHLSYNTNLRLGGNGLSHSAANMGQQFVQFGHASHTPNEPSSQSNFASHRVLNSNQSNHTSHPVFNSRQSNHTSLPVLNRPYSGTCGNYLNMTSSEYLQARAKEQYRISTQLEEQRLMMLLSGPGGGCTVFRQQRGYLDRPVNAEETAFPLAYALIVYRDAAQVERLLRAIYRPHNSYCVHVDAKPTSSHAFYLLKLLSRCFDNVYVLERRVAVEWGTISVLQPELMCMETLFKKRPSWKYFINLTGQEFPLKTNLEIIQILKEFHGKNLIGSHSFTEEEYARRISAPLTWYTNSSQLPEFPFQFKKGPVHIAATRQFVEFAVHAPSTRALLGLLRYTVIPDETFYATLQATHGVPGSFDNSTSLHNPPLRYKRWYGHVAWGPEVTQYSAPYALTHPQTCYGQIVRDICIPGIGDMPGLVRSRALFVNKLFYRHSPLTYDCLEELHWGKVQRELSGRGTGLKLGAYRRMYALLSDSSGSALVTTVAEVH